MGRCSYAKTSSVREGTLLERFHTFAREKSKSTRKLGCAKLTWSHIENPATKRKLEHAQRTYACRENSVMQKEFHDKVDYDALNEKGEEVFIPHTLEKGTHSMKLWD